MATGRSQGSPRDNQAAYNFYIKTGGALYHADYSNTTALIDANSTGLLLPGGLALSGEETDIITQDSTALLVAGGIALSGQASSNAITQNSSGVILPDSVTALPTSDEGTAFTLLTLSTGVVMAICTTGTTWGYVNMTSVLADAVLG